MADVWADLRRNQDTRGDVDSKEGSPEGSKLGTAVEGRFREMYADRIRGLLMQATSFSLLSDEELAKLKARAYVEVNDAGKIAKFRLETSSGNVRFDASVERALAQFAEDGGKRFPPFPPGSGIEKVFRVKVNFRGDR